MKLMFNCAGALVVAGVFFGSSSAFADPEEALHLPASERKRIEAKRLTVAPVLDGVISPGEYAGAATVSDFHQTRPREYEAPSQKTVVWVGYDDDYLYVAAHMLDTDPSLINANQLVQGGSMRGEDTFKLYLGPFNNMRSGYFFELNPNSVRKEALLEGNGGYQSFNDDWSTIWNGKATTGEDGWYAEMKIPFKSINFDPNNPVWGISFGRNFTRDNERMAWTSFDTWTGPNSMGEMVGVTGAKQGMGLDINSGLTVRQSKDDETGKDSFSIDPSVDVFYKITPSLTAVFTANTDFSATEVDDQVVNLSRFSLFLPEKRDFFLQDNDIFNFGDIWRNGKPFFSRRIGLDEDGQPIDILAGGKLTGRIGNFSVGVLDIVQKKGDGSGGEANLFVGRAAYQVNEDHQIGTILTHGDPIDGGGSYTMGFDYMLDTRSFIEGRRTYGNLWYQKTHTPGVEGKDTAWGADIGFPSRNGLFGEISYMYVGESFDPKLGFVNRAGQRIYSQSGYHYRPDGGLFERINAELMTYHVLDNDGNVESGNVNVRPLKLVTRDGDEITFSMDFDREVLLEPYEIVDGVIIPIGDHRFNAKNISIRTAGQRALSGGASIRWGDYFTGKNKEFRIDMNYRPMPGLSFRASYNHTDVDLPEGDFISRVMSLRADVAFNSEWSWITTVQFDNISDEGGVNSRVRYNPEPGQDFYFIINQGFQRLEDRELRNGIWRPSSRFRSTNRELAAKVGYTFRF